jgi:hypothetical protein
MTRVPNQPLCQRGLSRLVLPHEPKQQPERHI